MKRLFPVPLPSALLASAAFLVLSSCQAVRESGLAALTGPAVSLSKPFFLAKGSGSGPQQGNQRPFKGTARLDHVTGGLFFFDHDPSAPFSCTLKRRRNGSIHNWTIRPEPFLTDGASVPRAFWCLSGFGPFDYTKSAIIHDWLFEAHHRWCIAYYSGNERQMLRYREYADPTLTPKLREPLRSQMWPLGIVEASDFLEECIIAEGRLNSDVMEEIAAINSKPTITSGLRNLLASTFGTTVAPAKLSVGTSGQYHWATRGSDALRLWNADVSGRPNHASCIEMIRQLDSGPKPTLLDQAVEDGALSQSLVKRLRRSAHHEQDTRHQDGSR